MDIWNNFMFRQDAKMNVQSIIFNIVFYNQRENTQINLVSLRKGKKKRQCIP